MFTSVDKAIVALIMAICFLLNTWFHVSIPGFITADNITQLLAVLTPIVVYWWPNKPPSPQ